MLDSFFKEYFTSQIILSLFVKMPSGLCKFLLLISMHLILNYSNAQTISIGFDSSLFTNDSVFFSAQKVKDFPANKTDSLIQYAETYLGDRYKRGGITSKGFDCSGFTMTVFRHFGITLPHTSAGQGLTGVEVSKKNIAKGDLILFTGRNRRSHRIGHVGIVISAKGEQVRFIHSSVQDGVRIDRLDHQYYISRYIKAVRLPELHYR